MSQPNSSVQEVLQKFETISVLVDNFTKDSNFPTRGLLISGDAGIGKTHCVLNSIESNIPQKNIVYIKGSSITSPFFYVRLFQAGEKGRVLVIDDVDIINKTKNEMVTILDLMKGATEMTKGERILSWDRIQINTWMRTNKIPQEFDFQGSIVWITNETIEDIETRCGSHWKALRSRFSTYQIRLELQTKKDYTLHLIEKGLLGKECRAFSGGFSDKIIKMTEDFILNTWKSMDDITPRTAISIASTYHQFGNDLDLCERMIRTSHITSPLNNPKNGRN